MPASDPFRMNLLWLLSGLAMALVVACGSSDTGSNEDAPDDSESPESRGLMIDNLVCQLDPPTFTATAVGGIRSTLLLELSGITPVVTWLGDDDAVLSSKTGAAIEVIPAGETALFSIPSVLLDGMSTCRIGFDGAGTVPVGGKLQAEAVLTSELAK